MPHHPNSNECTIGTRAIRSAWSSGRRNVGFDIRPICDALGFAGYVSAWTLSYEVGRCKPDPAVFHHACRSLGVFAEHALMVGDTPADAAAVDAGCRVLVLPAGPPGSVNGLAAALRLALS